MREIVKLHMLQLPKGKLLFEIASKIALEKWTQRQLYIEKQHKSPAEKLDLKAVDISKKELLRELQQQNLQPLSAGRQTHDRPEQIAIRTLPLKHKVQALVRGQRMPNNQDAQDPQRHCQRQARAGALPEAEQIVPLRHGQVPIPG